jgi:hypothetical protein
MLVFRGNVLVLETYSVVKKLFAAKIFAAKIFVAKIFLQKCLLILKMALLPYRLTQFNLGLLEDDWDDEDEEDDFMLRIPTITRAKFKQLGLDPMLYTSKGKLADPKFRELMRITNRVMAAQYNKLHPRWDAEQRQDLLLTTTLIENALLRYDKKYNRELKKLRKQRKERRNRERFVPTLRGRRRLERSRRPQRVGELSDEARRQMEMYSDVKSRKGDALVKNTDCTGNAISGEGDPEDNPDSCWLDPISLDCIPRNKLYIAPNGNCYDATQLLKHIEMQESQGRTANFPFDNTKLSNMDRKAVIAIANG